MSRLNKGACVSNGVWFVRIGKSVKSAKSGFNTSPFSEIKNIGLLGAKVPRFSLESTDVSIKEVRCFRFPVPILFPREAVSVSPLLKKFWFCVNLGDRHVRACSCMAHQSV